MYKKPSNEKVIEVFRASAGLVKVAAEKLGVTPWTIYDWWKKDPELKKECDCYRESMINIAKTTIARNMESKNESVSQRASEFILERLSKADFSQRQEISADVNTVHIVNDWNDEELENDN